MCLDFYLLSVRVDGIIISEVVARLMIHATECISYLITSAQLAPLSLSLSLSLCTIVTLFVQRDRHIQTSKTKLKRRVESSRVESQPETLSKLSLRLSSFCCLFSAILFSLVSPSRCERQSATPLPRRVLSTFSSFFFLFFFSRAISTLSRFPMLYTFLPNCSYFFGI